MCAITVQLHLQLDKLNNTARKSDLVRLKRRPLNYLLRRPRQGLKT
jgi:hypothetical protein